MSDSMADPADPADLADPALQAVQPAPEPAPGPAVPRPLGVERAPTGDAEVDRRLARLADADRLPADGHIEVYEDVHRGLRDTLTALDAPPGPPGRSCPGDSPHR
jgi:hypothetical protein